MDMPKTAVEVEQCFNTSLAQCWIWISSRGLLKVLRRRMIWSPHQQLGQDRPILQLIEKEKATDLHGIGVCSISNLNPVMIHAVRRQGLDPSLYIHQELFRICQDFKLRR